MSEITKFLMDDHARCRRTFSSYHRTPWSQDEARNVCDHLWIHSKLEEEILYPVLRDSDAEQADAMLEEHRQVAALMQKIQRIQSDDPALARMMAQLHRLFEVHVRNEERVVFPSIGAKGRDLLHDLGREAFARRQQLFNERDPRTWRPMDKLANSGWGGGGRIANAGW